MFRCLLLILVAAGVVFGEADQAPGAAPVIEQNSSPNSPTTESDGATLSPYSGLRVSNMKFHQAMPASDDTCCGGSPCEKKPSCGCKPEPCKCKPCDPCPSCAPCTPCAACQPCLACPPCPKPKCKCQEPCSNCSEDDNPPQSEQNVAIEPQASQ